MSARQGALLKLCFAAPHPLHLESEVPFLCFSGSRYDSASYWAVVTVANVLLCTPWYIRCALWDQEPHGDEQVSCPVFSPESQQLTCRAPGHLLYGLSHRLHILQPVLLYRGCA